MILDIDAQLELISKGTVELINKDELKAKLIESQKKGKPLKIKLGADPSAPDIHFGHVVVLRKLKQFQDLGHEVIFVIGDFTGMIGDPSGKSKTRQPLTKEAVLKNAKTYKEQVGKILDISKTKIVFNSEWLSKMSFEEVLKLTGKVTVAQILNREDFMQRYKNDKPISLCEFLYPLMQAYDSVALSADVELGGTDQTFNLLLGRDLQKQFNQKPQVVITMPLLVGLDGQDKMSKSLGNYVGISDEPCEMFGKLMSIPDSLIEDYMLLLTDIDETKIRDYAINMEEGSINPKHVKEELAFEIVKTFHNEKEAKYAQEQFNKIFKEKKIPDNIKEIFIEPSMLKEGKIWIVKLITNAGLASSNSEARRLIQSNAVEIDRKKVNNVNKEVEIPEKGIILKVGKRRFARIFKKVI